MFGRLSILTPCLKYRYHYNLHWRDLSNENILDGIARCWFTNWQRNIVADFTSNSENIAGINPDTGLTGSCEGMFLPAIRDGQIIGGQIYPLVHIESKQGRDVKIPDGLGKYIWLSSSNQGGVSAHSFDTGEVPLFLREHPDCQPADIENLNLCEGALKSAIACLKFEERGCFEPFLGASGAIFSERELGLCLARYPNLKTVTLWPDAGSTENTTTTGSYQRAIALVTKLTGGNVRVLVAWWGQTTKAANDVDELTEKDFEKLTIAPWNNSIMVESTSAINSDVSPESTNTTKIKYPHFKSSIEDGLKYFFEKDEQAKNELGDITGETEKVIRSERIGDHIIAIAETDSIAGDDRALVIEFVNQDKKLRQITFDKGFFFGDASDALKRLSRANYKLTNRRHKDKLLDYLYQLGQGLPVIVLSAATGWHDLTYVGIQKSYGAKDIRFLDINPPANAPVVITGTLADWIDGVARPSLGNSRPMLAIGLAFAGSLVSPLGLESGAFNFWGTSGHGKTTIAKIACSVTGHKTPYQWRSTPNGLEALFRTSNDFMMPMDELAKDMGRYLGEVIYMLNGRGKNRMDKKLGSAETGEWETLMLSTSEKSSIELMEDEGERQKSGQEVRFTDIPAAPDSNVRGWGCFETAHGQDPYQMALAIEQACGKNHGVAFDTFITQLQQARQSDQEWDIKHRAGIESIADRLTGEAKNPSIRRVARRFAVIELALNLASQWQILPWSEYENKWAVDKVFEEWFVERDGDGSSEAKKTCDNIRQMVTTYELTSRFFVLPHNDQRPTGELLGYRELDIDGSTRRFLVPTAIFDKYYCHKTNKNEVIAELDKRGWIEQPGAEGRWDKRLKNPIIKSRCCILKSSILEGEKNNFLDRPKKLGNLGNQEKNRLELNTSNDYDGSQDSKKAWELLGTLGTLPDQGSQVPNQWEPTWEPSGTSENIAEKEIQGQVPKVPKVPNENICNPKNDFKDDQKELNINLPEQVNDEYFTPGDFDHE